MNSNFESYTLEDLISDESFQKWAKSIASPEETELWNKLYQDNPKLRELMGQAKAVVLEFSRTEPEVDHSTVDNAWQELEQRIDSPTRTIPITRWLGYAAAVAVVVLGSILLMDQSSDLEYITYQSGYGEKRAVELPDGTHVTLNANSILRVPAIWEGDSRNVWLEQGEGFFHVTKTSDKQRFVVHVDDLDVTVLGTQFNINRHNKDIKVLLKEGKVKLSVGESEQLLAPGELASYSANTEHLLVQNVEVSDYDSWLRNKIVFDNTSLSEVAQIMHQYYGVEVDIADDLKDRSVSGEIPNDNLQLLLNALRVTLNLNITYSENEVVIAKNTD